MGNQVSLRRGLPNIPSLCLTADEGVKGIVGQGRMGVSGLGVFIAAARGVRGVAGGVRGGYKGGARRGRPRKERLAHDATGTASIAPTWIWLSADISKTFPEYL